MRSLSVYRLSLGFLGALLLAVGTLSQQPAVIDATGNSPLRTW